MECRHSVSPRPKNSESKIRWKISRLLFFRGGSRRRPPHLLSSKAPNYQRGVLLISAGKIGGHFEGKTPREAHQSGLVLERHRPGSLGTCNPKETGLPGIPMSISPTLFSGSVPVGLPPAPWTAKQLKSRHFSSDAEVIAAAENWLDGNILIFFLSGL